MKKYKYHLIATAVLVGIALFLFLKDKSGTLRVDAKAFAVADTAGVTSITITNNQAKLVLERSGTGWRINQNFNAKPHAVRALLSLLTSLEIGAPVPKSMKQQVLSSFNDNVVSVSVESSGTITKAFRISGNDQLKIGSVGMLKDDTDPYVIHLPNFEGNLYSLFSTNSLLWRDKTIFRYRPADILSIEVVYSDNPNASFAYHFMGMDNLQIESLKTRATIKLNKETAQNYLTNFASLSFESLVINRTKEVRDSLTRQKPLCTITVKNTANQLNTIKTYRIPVQNQPGMFNLNRIYAVLQNDTVPVIIKYLNLDPIMKEYNDFASR
jgi:hypothetical protein